MYLVWGSVAILGGLKEVGNPTWPSCAEGALVLGWTWSSCAMATTRPGLVPVEVVAGI